MSKRPQTCLTAATPRRLAKNPLAQVTSVILTKDVTDAPPTPAERLRLLLYGLSMAASSRHLTGRLAAPLFALIFNRIVVIRQAIARLATRLTAGHLTPRKSGGPRPGRQAGTRNRLPSSPAWLIKLVPEAAAAASQLRSLLTDPEVAAFLAADPARISRPLRSLCRMLDVEPPLPAPPRPARPKKPEQRKTPAPAGKPPGRPRYVFGLRYPPPLPDPA